MCSKWTFYVAIPLLKCAVPVWIGNQAIYSLLTKSITLKYCSSPAPGLSSGFVHILPWRIWAGSRIRAVQTAAPVQPTERKSQHLRVVHKSNQPRNQILQLITHWYNKQIFHKWITVWLNEILCCTWDRYFQKVVSQALTAGHLMLLCQKIVRVWSCCHAPSFRH